MKRTETNINFNVEIMIEDSIEYLHVVRIILPNCFESYDLLIQ